MGHEAYAVGVPSYVNISDLLPDTIKMKLLNSISCGKNYLIRGKISFNYNSVVSIQWRNIEQSTHI